MQLVLLISLTGTQVFADIIVAEAFFFLLTNQHIKRVQTQYCTCLTISLDTLTPK